jgi:hypothetical protein
MQAIMSLSSTLAIGLISYCLSFSYLSAQTNPERAVRMRDECFGTFSLSNRTPDQIRITRAAESFVLVYRHLQLPVGSRPDRTKFDDLELTLGTLNEDEYVRRVMIDSEAGIAVCIIWKGKGSGVNYSRLLILRANELQSIRTGQGRPEAISLKRFEAMAELDGRNTTPADTRFGIEDIIQLQRDSRGLVGTLRTYRIVDGGVKREVERWNLSEGIKIE